MVFYVAEVDSKMEPIKLKSVKRSSLSKQVIDQIIQLLSSGQLKPGDKLPTEMELLDMLFVSRPILREALSSLETIGIIHRKTKEGTYFSEKIGSNAFRIMLSLSANQMETIIDARISQELGFVTLAAERMTTQILERLRETIRAMETNKDDYMDADREFHRIIAYSGSNMITEGMIDPLLTMFDDTFQNISTENRDKALTLKQHQDIYNALVKRDPIESYICMYHHLNRVRNSLLGSLSNKHRA